MEFFYKYFGRDNPMSHDEREMHVKCPFPHVDAKGNHYYEQIPSAHINLERSVFHCKVCAQGMSEASFLAKVNSISWMEAKQMLQEMDKRKSDTEVWSQWVENLKTNDFMMNELKQLGLDSMVDELQLGFQGDGIAFPVFAYGSLLDVRTYDPDSRPKVKSEKGAGSNIIPFDLWVDDERPTLLCAGEKDMAIARKHGFNAITFTGGEQSFPKLWKGSMRVKTFYIVYDNDSAGHDGAIRVATLLKEIGANPYVVTGHYEVCTGKGEDIHDFFQKYHKTADDLETILRDTDPFSESLYSENRDKIYPLVRLEESSQGRFSKRLISSRVQVISEYDTPFKIPAIVTFTKFDTDEKDPGFMKVGEERAWSLHDKNIQDILHLCDGNIKEKDIIANIKELLRIHPKEKYIRVSASGEIPIWKAVITDDVESEIVGKDYKPSELTVYSIDQRLHSGSKYRIFYKAVAHPLQAMKVVGVSNRSEESDNSVSSFKMTPEIMESLKCFQGEPEEKMKEIAERVKAIAGPETRTDIAFTVDLFYHTPLQFLFGDRLERGYLDCMLIGDPRTGKSQTAKKLLETYELGTFVSLKSATVPSLIGGSQGTSSGGYKTRLGIIPRNHKSAIILEEFSGAPRDMISTLTEVRSSNKVRIHRVSGDVTADAFVRMLTISNQRTNSVGQTIPLRQYPDGIHIITDLIGAAEDIARYDFFILVEKPDSNDYVSPTTKVDIEPFPKESYTNRIRWVWSRKPEQIIINEDVREYIVECAKALNKNFDSHIGFFGAEAWKKVSRVAIACAGCCASMDETGELLVVKMEHVQWASRFLKNCYDNELFRLRNYVDEERAYTVVSDKAISALQGIYNRNKALVNQMERSTEITQNQLRAVSGLPNDDFNKVMNHLAECRFFRWSGSDKIIPSERFRKALAKVKRNVYPQTIGGD